MPCVRGHFYSSSGPEVYEWGVREGQAGREVYVECSPAQKVYFLTYPGRGYARLNPEGGTITTAVYRPRGNELYIRAEVVDPQGRMAWTNPLFLQL